MLVYFSDLDRLERDAAVQNVPLWFGEWSISTNFDATDEFLNQWADAQKFMYSKSAGWIVSLPRLAKTRLRLLITDPPPVLELQTRGFSGC